MVTIREGTEANVVVGLANVYVGTANDIPAATAANHIGYSEDGVMMTYTPTITEIPVAEENFPVKDILTSEEIKVTLAFAEATAEAMGWAISGANVTAPNTVILGGGSATYVSLLIEGDAPGENSGTREVFLPKVIPTGAVGVPFKKAEKTLVPVEFVARKPNVGEAVTISDVWDYTPSTGSIALVAGKTGMRIAGEGDAADTLTAVTGGTAGDELFIRIADESNAITISDGTASTQINITAAFVMDDYRDWLHVTNTGGVWVETARLDIDG